MATESILESFENETSALSNRTFNKRMDTELEISLNVGIVVYLIFLVAIGVIGNVHTLIIFAKRKPSNFRELVMTLATMDLVCVCVCVPLNIVDILFFFTPPSDLLCKITRFVSYSFSIASLSFLFGVAFERYRKICRPLHWQFSKRTLRIMNAAFLAASMILCSPKLVISGLVDKTYETSDLYINTINVTICDTMRDSFEHILHFSLLLLLVSLVIAIVVFYVLIVRAILKSRHLPNNKENAKSTVRKGNLKGAKFRAIICMVVTIVSYIGIIYIFMDKSFRKEVKDLYTCFGTCPLRKKSFTL